MKDICDRAMDSRLTGLMLLTARVESVDLGGATAAGFLSIAPGSGLYRTMQAAHYTFTPGRPQQTQVTATRSDGVCIIRIAI